MATYLVGDLHGCLRELNLLLQQAQFDPQQDELWLTGDLVARGEDSLGCLRFVRDLGTRAHTVLGNHDLHLLSCAQGIKSVKPKDNLDALFDAPDCDELLEWLRHQPLLLKHPTHGFLLSHAGISPDWNEATAFDAARFAEKGLQSAQFADLLAQMYDNEPNLWQENLTGIQRWRYIVNAFTRMRFIERHHRLDFACKLTPNDAPETLVPWFEGQNPLFRTHELVFGHWAALLGYPTPANIYALDSGCVWGNYLTLLRWEDKARFTQPRLAAPLE